MIEVIKKRPYLTLAIIAMSFISVGYGIINSLGSGLVCFGVCVLVATMLSFMGND